VIVVIFQQKKPQKKTTSQQNKRLKLNGQQNKKNLRQTKRCLGIVMKLF
jgi:hypothetical protein